MNKENCALKLVDEIIHDLDSEDFTLKTEAFHRSARCLAAPKPACLPVYIFLTVQITIHLLLCLVSLYTHEPISVLLVMHPTCIIQ